MTRLWPKVASFCLLMLVANTTCAQESANTDSKNAEPQAVESQHSSSSARRLFELKHFRPYGFYAYQKGATDEVEKKGWFMSAGLSWNPEFRFLPFLALVGDFGGLILKSKSFGDLFLGLDYRLMLSIRPLKRIFLELGAGGQTWTNHGTYAAFAMQAGFIFGESRAFQFIDRVWIGYTQVDLGTLRATEVLKVGLGFEF